MLPLLLCRFAQTSAAVLLAGTVVLRLLARGTNLGDTPSETRLAFGSWCVLLGASVLHLCLTAADMSGQPLAQAFSGGALGIVLWGTRFGEVWLIQASLLAGLFIVETIRATQPRHTHTRVAGRWDATGALLVGSLLASFTWTAHANASEKRAWLLPVDMLHAVAAGAWPGGLLPLTLLLRRTRHHLDLLPATVTVTRRFSRLSVAAVAILALTGLLNACGLVGTLSALWSGGYGRLLLCKAALFAAMIGFGAVNRRLIRQQEFENSAATLQRLRRNVAWECALAVGVLLATEALAMSVPPASSG